MKRRQQGILTGMPFMANITPRTFVDTLGRKLFLAKAPSRVVSMAPNVTEMLFALGLEEKVVAVTPFCDYPPEAQSKTHLGGTNPSIEQILALKPDLVLAPQDIIQQSLLLNLDRVKVPIFVLQAAQLEDVLAQIQTVARMFDRSKAGDELAATIRQRIAVVKERTQSLAHPRVLYVLNTDPLQTVGPGSFIHQLIEAAGGANIAAARRRPIQGLRWRKCLRAIRKSLSSRSARRKVFPRRNDSSGSGGRVCQPSNTIAWSLCPVCWSTDRGHGSWKDLNSLRRPFIPKPLRASPLKGGHDRPPVSCSN